MDHTSLDTAFMSPFPRYNHGPAPWALVTGASDVIGFAFAQELSQRGSNVVLHGRNASKLAACQAQLEKESSGVKFGIFIADVTRDPDEAIVKFVQSARELDLTVLVNNVGGTKGFLDKDFKLLSDHSPAEIINDMQANTRFSTVLTAALLLILVQHQPSLIINTGSTSAVGMPYLSVTGPAQGDRFTRSPADHSAKRPNFTPRGVLLSYYIRPIGP